MLDYQEYTTNGDGYQGKGNNGYDQLEGEWLTYYKVGKAFIRKVKPEDREDFLHDLFLAFARVKVSYDAKGKELTTGGLVRIAQYRVKNYWRRQYIHHYALTCSQCSKAQKARCKKDNLYSQCPRTFKIESLNELVDDGDGNKTELYQFIADDNADFIPRLDAKLILESYPRRFVDLAYKKYAGYILTESERSYYRREQKKAQKSLV